MHNANKDCWLCQKAVNEKKQEAVVKIIENTTGDPYITAGPGQVSVSTFKDMYQIFEQQLTAKEKRQKERREKEKTAMTEQERKE